MKKIFLIPVFLVLLFSCEENISDKQSEYFIKFYGSYLEDIGYDMEPTPDGGVVIVGSTTDNVKGKQIILIKVDKYGNHASWSPRKYGSELEDVGYSIKVLKDGYIIAGSSRGMDEGKDLDAYIIKTDKNGNVVWENLYETSIGEYDNEAFDILPLSAGGYIFAGYSAVSGSDRNIALVVLDEEGNMLKWSNRGNVNEQLSVIFEHQDESYIVLGTKLYSDLDFFLLKINQDGNDMDNSRFGEPGRDDVLNSACMGKNNTFLLTGTSSGISDGRKQILLIKYNSDSDQVEWQKIIGGPGNFEGKAVRQLANGNIILVGDKLIADNKNIILYFLTPEGEILSTREYGNSGNQSAEDLIIIDDHLFILGKNSFEGNSMITLIKTDIEGDLWE